MKRRYFLAFVLTALAGSALHFGFALCPSPLVGLFCPVSESVWEHLKLLYWPFLDAAFCLTRGAADSRQGWCALLIGLLAAPVLLLGAYYPLVCGFSLHGLWLDILLYMLALAGGFFLAYRLRLRALPGALCGPVVIAAGLYGAALALFSFAPPELPIFLPPA